MPAADSTLAKTALRDQLTTARGRRPLAEVSHAGRALAEQVLAAPEVRRAGTLTAYVAIGGEPGTSALLDALLAARKRVLLPVLLPDFDLDWTVYTGPDSLARARRGLLEPVGPREGVEAIGWADVVLVPGLAVSRSGQRLGKGAGCYDRALARVPVGTPVACLLYDDEVLGAVPSEPHDRPVTHAVTPSGWHRLG